ncbi:unnamed protein product, partial [Brassica napus]
LLSINLKACVLIQKRSLQQTLTRRWLEAVCSLMPLREPTSILTRRPLQGRSC